MAVLNSCQKTIAHLIAINILGLSEVKQYDLIVEMYNCIKKKVTSEELLNQYKSSLYTPDQQFYDALGFIVISEFENNYYDLVNTFIEHFKGRFLELYNEINGTVFLDEEQVVQLFGKYMLRNNKLVMDIQVSPNSYAQILILNKADKAGISGERITKMSEIWDKNSNHYKYTYYYKAAIIDRFSKEEDIEKYLKLCYSGLAKKLAIPESKLEKYFLDLCKITSFFSLDNYIKMMLETSSSSSWWYKYSLEKKSEFKELYYHPNVKQIINNRFLGFLADWKTKDCDPTHVSNKAVSLVEVSDIVDAIKIDVLNHLFEYTKKKYFELKLKEIDGGFSTDVKNSSNSNYIELQQKIVDLETEVQNKNQEIKTLKEELSNVGRKYEKHFKSQLTKFVDETIERYEDFKTDFHNARNENVVLKELVNYLQQPEPEPAVPDDFKVQRLYHMRLLFVGDLTRFGHPELKALFPNSVFMESETADISNLDIEFVVLLTKYMSHAMYYKLCSQKYLYEKMWVNFNTRNYDLLLKTIYSRVNFIGYDEHGE